MARSWARSWVRAGIAALVVLGSAGASAAELIATVDYSDTFTVAEEGGVAERTDGSVGAEGARYDVEDSHGNAASTWVPQNLFSFNTGLGSTCCGYSSNEGNDGAATGLAQSSGGDFSFAYGLRTSYVVELDAILPLDRLDITTLPTPGGGIGTANSISVFIRLDSVAGSPHPAFPGKGLPGIGLYNGAVETGVSDAEGAWILSGVDDAGWHAFAVHFDGDEGTLRVFVDRELVAKVDLSSFAGGTYRNFSNGAVGVGGAGYNLASRVLWVDNFRVGEPSAPTTRACFSAVPASGPAPLTVTFDAACSDPGAGIGSYGWDFGDGSTATGAIAEHTYAAGGSYQVTLTVTDTGGGMTTATRTVVVHDIAESFSDDFDRPDGPIDGWTVYAVPGAWNISGGELVTSGSTEERWIWAGDPPVLAPSGARYSFEQAFLGPGTDIVVGRHAGFVFCASEPTHRYAGGFRGYFVDWIDRPDDRGPRFTRVDGGVLVEIVRGQATLPPESVPAEPPLLWEVEFEDDTIRLFGDGALLFEVVDGTYRGGHFGFWAYSSGQDVSWDDLTMQGDALSAYFAVDLPPVPLAGTPFLFDATGSRAIGGTIDSYEWDFGDGNTGTGATVSHAFEFAGDYQVTLTVRAGAESDAYSRGISVAESLAPFADCFDRTPGPVDGWTAAMGDWAITADGAAEVTTAAGAEAFLYAGDPPRGLPATFVTEVDWTYLGGNLEGNGVGRHGAVSFYWNRPTTNRFAADSRGYSLFWIDRENDRGLNLTRWDNGALVLLNPPGGTPEIAEPPGKVRIEVDDTRIRVLADGVLAIDVEDSTYRDGYYALWAWQENAIRFDDVLIGEADLPSCGGIQPKRFLRGDPNDDGSVNITDGIYILNFLFLGGPEPTCRESANPNDDAAINITDGIYLLNYLFLGGPEPLAPGPAGKALPCGPDRAGSPSDLGCLSYTNCD